MFIFTLLLRVMKDFDPNIQISIVITFMFAVLGWANRYVPINFGRHLTSLSRVNIPNSVAWMVMEGPNLANLFYFLARGRISLVENPMNLIYVLPFLVHYINRTIIYPLRNPSTKPLPLEIVAAAFTFTFANSYIQCALFLDRGPLYSTADLALPRFWAGWALFLVGMYTNVRADNLLARLKRELQQRQKAGEDKEYQIPHGFLFNYVSCPNYFGEILEWFGYALTSCTFQGLWFALFTLSYLLARGLDNHRWYLDKFKNYPRQRQAVIPFLL